MGNLCLVRVTLPSVRVSLSRVEVTLPCVEVTFPRFELRQFGCFSWQKLKHPIKTSREIKYFTIDPTKSDVLEKDA